MKFRHVVLDLDGTLVDTKDDLAAAVNVALVALDLPPQDIRTLLGYVGNGARALMERALGVEHGAKLEAALDIFMPWYREHLLDHAAVYPGLRAVLDTLAGEGVLFSVLTNKPEDMSAKVLRGFDLEGLCPRLIGGDTLPARKPDPMGLLQLIEAVGIPASDTLMVGDSPIDVETGKSGQTGTCAVFWGFNGDAARGMGADAEITAPEELLAVCRGSR